MRFGIYGSSLAQQDVVILLVGIGFLCNFIYEYFSVEHAMRFVLENALVVLVRLTVWLVVMHGCVVVYQLFIPNDGNTIHEGIDIFSCVNEVKIVSNQFTSESKSIHCR